MEFSYLPYVSVINMVMWYLLIFCGCVFLIYGLDGLLYDTIYWTYIFYQRITGKNKLHYFSNIPKPPEKRIAIMVACWHEDLVIGNMLRYNQSHIKYNNYDFFVGVYPNDPKTIEAVQNMAEQFNNIHCVIGDEPGPTRKAGNLNNIFKYIMKYEKETKQHYDIFVIHDAEDVIHPQSLTLINYGLSTDFDMVQIPIFPLPVKMRYFTHWVYNDEFAEAHSKDIVVRQLLKGFVPSAGVGTGISRKAMQMLSANYSEKPFNSDSLTEDYNVSLRIHMLGLKAKLLLIRNDTTVTKQPFSYIATRSLFPTYYKNAIRQRARWTLGITMQEWGTSGWPGNWATKFSLFHDRKALFSNFVSGFAYIVFFYWVFEYIFAVTQQQIPVLTLLLDANPLVEWLIIVVTLLMLERVLQRVIATTHIYGIKAGLLSILRAPYGNILNFHTILVALKRLIKAKIDKQPISWEKTANAFPQLNKKEK